MFVHCRKKRGGKNEDIIYEIIEWRCKGKKCSGKKVVPGLMDLLHHSEQP